MRSIATVILSLVSYGCCLSSGLAQPHFIVIGVDGLSVDGVVKASTPHMHELMARGAWTLEARGVMPTLSSPNWASIIDGAGPEQHGITSNGYLRRMVEIEPVYRDAEGMFPTIFKVMRTQRPGSLIAIIHDWAGFADLVEKDVPNVMRHEHGSQQTTDAAMRYWEENRPDLMFVHLDNVDHTGHDLGWATPAYYRAVAEADGHIGAIVDMLRRLSALDSTFVLITSDHGGKGRNHGKNSLAEIQIPWILAGPGILPGRITSSVYTFDTAATIARVFELDMPECWIGRPVQAAFRPVHPQGTGTTTAARSAVAPGSAPGAPDARDPETGHNVQPN